MWKMFEGTGDPKLDALLILLCLVCVAFVATIAWRVYLSVPKVRRLEDVAREAADVLDGEAAEDWPSEVAQITRIDTEGLQGVDRSILVTRTGEEVPADEEAQEQEKYRQDLISLFLGKLDGEPGIMPSLLLPAERAMQRLVLLAGRPRDPQYEDLPETAQEFARWVYHSSSEPRQVLDQIAKANVIDMAAIESFRDIVRDKEERAGPVLEHLTGDELDQLKQCRELDYYRMWHLRRCAGCSQDVRAWLDYRILTMQQFLRTIGAPTRAT